MADVVSTNPEATPAAEPRPWRAAAGCLAFLAPFFFLVYGFTNWLTAQRGEVPSFYFAWELRLPFVPQLMLPYMSIDLFFAVSFFVCRTRAELSRHAQRILAAILISAAGFLLFPLRFAFERPAVDGFNGWLLEVLTGFDKPYNQAPSLHVSLLLILWVVYARHLHGGWRWLLHLWFTLIGLSVVLVFQHHVIDVITGLAAGLLCLYLVPDPPHAMPAWQRAADPRRRQLARRYGVGAFAAALVAAAWQGAAWLLLWPATALALVAAGYMWWGPEAFQKHNGRHSLAARSLLAPYLIGAWISCWLHTQGRPAYVRVTDDVYLGRMPRCREARNAPWRTVVDLTAEFSACAAAGAPAYTNVAMLDLAAPEADALRRAAAAIEQARRHGPVLVHCALGASRSVAAVIAWMVRQGQAGSVTEAEHRLAALWYRIVLTDAHRVALQQALA